MDIQYFDLTVLFLRSYVSSLWGRKINNTLPSKEDVLNYFWQILCFIFFFDNVEVIPGSIEVFISILQSKGTFFFDFVKDSPVPSPHEYHSKVFHNNAAKNNNCSRAIQNEIVLQEKRNANAKYHLQLKRYHQHGAINCLPLHCLPCSPFTLFNILFILFKLLNTA